VHAILNARVHLFANNLDVGVHQAAVSVPSVNGTLGDLCSAGGAGVNRPWAAARSFEIYWLIVLLAGIGLTVPVWL